MSLVIGAAVAPWPDQLLNVYLVTVVFALDEVLVEFPPVAPA